MIGMRYKLATAAAALLAAVAATPAMAAGGKPTIEVEVIEGPIPG